MGLTIGLAVLLAFFTGVMIATGDHPVALVSALGTIGWAETHLGDQ